MCLFVTLSGSRDSFGTRSGQRRMWGHGGPSNSNLNSGGAAAQKEMRFKYVEEIYRAIPSFWTLGEPEVLLLPDDFESFLEDDC